MNIECTATNGARCQHERHRFRIGIAADQATEFRSRRAEFLETLTHALLDHVAAGRPGKPAAGLFLQVWTAAQWRNVQNPTSGNVVAITHLIAGQQATADTLFDLACNAVQMARDLDVLTGGLVREATE